jgi:hypothetical protein
VSAAESSFLNVSGYNAPVHIKAPKNPLSLGEVHRRISTPGLQPAGDRSAGTTEEQRQAKELNGTWLASGTLVASHNFSEQAGAMFRRVWVIRSGCKKGDCGLVMVRVNEHGNLVAGLSWQHGDWTARFANTVTCNGGPVLPEADQMTLSIAGSRLTAREQVNTGPDCGTGGYEITSWSAERELAAPGSHPNS